MPDSVAVEGDVQAVPGVNSPTPNIQSGTWQAGAISYSSYNRLKIGGAKVIYQAECTFTYRGGKDTSTSALIEPAPTETVTLVAGTTKLQKGSQSVLVDGDNEVITKTGNELKVQITRKLKTD
jgi:hypothetical protein